MPWPLDYLQQRRLQHLSWQPVPLLSHPHSAVFPCVLMEHIHSIKGSAPMERLKFVLGCVWMRVGRGTAWS